MEPSAKPDSSSRTQFDPALLSRLRAALKSTAKDLLAERNPAGHWIGELSSSHLTTATAEITLATVDRHSSSKRFGQQLANGLKWLEENVNEDGGWGDTGSIAACAQAEGGAQESTLSNISTTALCWAAFGAVQGADAQYQRLVANVLKWLRAKVQASVPDANVSSDFTNNPAPLVDAIVARYGKDRT